MKENDMSELDKINRLEQSVEKLERSVDLLEEKLSRCDKPAKPSQFVRMVRMAEITRDARRVERQYIIDGLRKGGWSESVMKSIADLPEIS
jgi:hypothetical protein